MTDSISFPRATITVEDVRALAVFAALPLDKNREAAVAAILNAWVPDANALSRKMSDAKHQALVPSTVFTHPESCDGEA